MANNLIQIKRTSVSGRAANTTTLTNPGELALNMTDGIMYSTNGSSVFEIGANNTNQRVTGTLTINAVSANGTTGTSGQVLTSNGTSTYWASSSTLNAEQRSYTYTLAANTTVISGADDAAQSLNYTAGLESVFINGVRQISGVDYNTTNAAAITLTANAIAGEVVQVITFAGAVNSTNSAAQYTWTNSHVFSNTVTLNGGVNANSGFTANGSVGSAGQILTSDGSKPYWQTQQFRTAGQITLGANTTLDASYLGENILVTAADITITLPTSGFNSGTLAFISNISGGTVNLSYAYAGDGPTKLYPGDSIVLITDGNGSSLYWRQYSYTNVLGLEPVTAVSALDVDCSKGTYFTKTIAANSTFTFSNVPASGNAYSFTLDVTHTSGTITWPASVKWPSDTAPTLTTGKTHLFMFTTRDGGTRWRGSALVDYVN